MNTNKCPICTSNKCKTLYSGKVESQIVMRFAICMNCDHSFADPMPSNHNLHYFYKKGIYSTIQEIRGDSWKKWGSDEAIEDYNKTFINKVGLGKIHISYFKKIVGNLKLSGICLDFGCGVGGILTAFSKEYGLKAMGVELDSKKVQTAKQNGVEIISEDVIDDDDWLNINQNNVALIIATDFLEHLIDPVTFVKTLQNKFPKAIFFFGVPGFGQLYIDKHKPLISHVLNLPHIQKFSPQSICDTFTKIDHTVSFLGSKSMRYFYIVSIKEMNFKKFKTIIDKRKSGKLFRKYYLRQLMSLINLTFRTFLTLIFGRLDLKNFLKGKPPT